MDDKVVADCEKTSNVCNIEYAEFDKAVTEMREFFKSKGFVEVHTQNRLRILAACEDPTTMAT